MYKRVFSYCSTLEFTEIASGHYTNSGRLSFTASDGDMLFIATGSNVTYHYIDSISSLKTTILEGSSGYTTGRFYFCTVSGSGTVSVHADGNSNAIYVKVYKIN